MRSRKNEPSPANRINLSASESKQIKTLSSVYESPEILAAHIQLSWQCDKDLLSCQASSSLYMLSQSALGGERTECVPVETSPLF